MNTLVEKLIHRFVGKHTLLTVKFSCPKTVSLPAERHRSAARPASVAMGNSESNMAGRVSCSGLILIEASPSAYPSGMLALGKEPLTQEEETSCDSTPCNTHFTVVSICTPAPCTFA